MNGLKTGILAVMIIVIAYSCAPRTYSSLQKCLVANMPADLSSTIRTTGERPLNEKMFVALAVFKSDGKTQVRNMPFYLCHRDYSKGGQRTVYGWGKTDSLGRFGIHSVSPFHFARNTDERMTITFIKQERDTTFITKELLLQSSLSAQPVSQNNNQAVPITILQRADSLWTGKATIILQ